MKKVILLFLTSLFLLSCADNNKFNKENIIPTPKEFTIQDNKLYPIKEVVNSEKRDNLKFPHNNDEYYLKSSKRTCCN